MPRQRELVDAAEVERRQRLGLGPGQVRRQEPGGARKGFNPPRGLNRVERHRGDRQGDRQRRRPRSPRWDFGGWGSGRAPDAVEELDQDDPRQGGRNRENARELRPHSQSQDDPVNDRPTPLFETGREGDLRQQPEASHRHVVMRVVGVGENPRHREKVRRGRERRDPSFPPGEVVEDQARRGRRQRHGAEPIRLERRQPVTAEPPARHAEQGIKRRVPVWLLAAERPVTIENRLLERPPPSTAARGRRQQVKPIVEQAFATDRVSLVPGDANAAGLYTQGGQRDDRRQHRRETDHPGARGDGSFARSTLSRHRSRTSPRKRVGDFRLRTIDITAPSSHKPLTLRLPFIQVDVRHRASPELFGLNAGLDRTLSLNSISTQKKVNPPDEASSRGLVRRSRRGWRNSSLSCLAQR